jgi:hypothetical protein
MKSANNVNPAPAAEKPKRVIKRVEPFSEWQLLVQARCQEDNISTRALAAKIATPERKFEHTTIWSWLRSPEGSPPSETYTADLNRRLAKALGITPERLAEAFDNSRRKFAFSSPHASQQGPLNILAMLFKSSSRKSWTTAEIVKLLDDARGL